MQPSPRSKKPFFGEFSRLVKYSCFHSCSIPDAIGVYRGWSYIRVWLFIHYCINSNFQTSITGSVQQQSSSIFEYLSCSTLFKKDSRCEQCLSNRWFNHHLVKVGPMLMFASSFVQDLNRRRNRFVRTASNRGICGGVFCHSRRLHRKTFIWS